MADLIDRQAAIDAVRSYYDECDERGESIEERIEQLPSAQPEPHGVCTDLIDRQALLEWFKNWSDYDEFSVGYITGVIEDEPSADAVKIVRCKDCKWYKKNYSWNGKEFKICVREPTEPARRPDDFCSYGERKDG